MTTDSPQLPTVAVDIHGAAKALSVSISTVRRLRGRGLLRPVNSSIKRVTFAVAELERFTRENTPGGFPL